VLFERLLCIITFLDAVKGVRMYFMAGRNVLLLLSIQSKEYISICEVSELEHRTAYLRIMKKKQLFRIILKSKIN